MLLYENVLKHKWYCWWFKMKWLFVFNVPDLPKPYLLLNVFANEMIT